MRPLRVRTLLLAILAVGLAGAAWLSSARALRAMREFSHAQALARVEATALLARAALENAGNELVVTASLLAERPTLQRLLAADDRVGLREFLSSYAATGELVSLALLRDAEPIALGGERLDPALIERSKRWQPRAWYAVPASDGAGLQLAAICPIAGDARGEVLVVERLPLLHAQPSPAGQGIATEFVDLETALHSFEDPRSVVWGLAVDDSMLLVRREAAAASYLAAAPIRDRSDAIVGVVSAALPIEQVDAPRRLLGRRFLRDVVVLTSILLLVAWWVGLRISRGMEELTSAASRIGEGDLESPVPRSEASVELLQLGRVMEEMRRRLLDLTMQLRNEREESESVLHGIADGVFVVDRERRIRYLNPQMATILGVEEGAAMGRFCGDVLRPLPVDGQRPCDGRCPILEARATGSARRAERLPRPGGEERVVLISSSVPSQLQEGGTGTRQFQVVRDETDVEASRRLRDNVVATISHEFRTPLSAQLASLEMLRDRVNEAKPQDLQPLLRSMERSTLRLTRLIDNLLESLSIDAGRASLRRQELEVQEICDEAVELTLPLLEQKGQRIRLDLHTPLPRIEGDGVRLVQVLVNLLANANKFAPAEGTVSLGAQTTQHGVLLWVEDDGPGLPWGADARLFERFVRAAGDEPGESGLGLGLWLVKSIVERHGGSVVAKRLPRGTRIEVELPHRGAP
jgi:signal transduction histidine kinase